MRKTLKKYYSQVVQVRGIYCGPAPKHEEPVPISSLTGRPENTCVKGLLRVTSQTLGPDTELFDCSETSLLLQVEGMGDYRDIKEDHVIIQGRLSADLRQTVTIQGYVYRYTKGNGDYDYGIQLETAIRNRIV